MTNNSDSDADSINESDDDYDDNEYGDDVDKNNDSYGRDNDERLNGKSVSHCIHHIRKYAEKIIKSSSQNDKDSCTEGEKSEDEDIRGKFHIRCIPLSFRIMILN